MYFFLFVAQQSNSGLNRSILEVSRSHKLVTCTASRTSLDEWSAYRRISFGWSNQKECDGWGTWHYGRQERYIERLVGDLKERKHLKGIEVD